MPTDEVEEERRRAADERINEMRDKELQRRREYEAKQAKAGKPK